MDIARTGAEEGAFVDANVYVVSPLSTLAWVAASGRTTRAVSASRYKGRLIERPLGTVISLGACPPRTCSTVVSATGHTCTVVGPPT